MFRSSTKVCAILMMAWSALVLAFSTAEMETHGLRVIGTVEGKTYFFENGGVNWTTAKERCEKAGMHQATITSSGQLELLQTFRNVTTNYYYWLGARDAQTPAHFAWDRSNETLSIALFPKFEYTTIQTCVAYRPTISLIPQLQSWTCKALCYTLCEIIHNRKM